MQYIIKIKDTIIEDGHRKSIWATDKPIDYFNYINAIQSLISVGYIIYFNCVDYPQDITCTYLERIENGKQTAKN